MTWLLLTGAGLVAETLIIVVLGRTATARYDLENALPQRPDHTVRGSGRGIRPGLLDDDRGVAERMHVVRDAIR